MRITTKGRYALRAVYTLATSSSKKPVSIRELAEKEDISPEFLEQIFFRLKKTGMISSLRGPGGGFRLNQSPEEITLYNILDAAGEGIEFTPCLIETPKKTRCERIEQCIAHKVWKDALIHMKDYFQSISLKDIIEDNTV